jgi:hypothetical protein
MREYWTMYSANVFFTSLIYGNDYWRTKRSRKQWKRNNSRQVQTQSDLFNVDCSPPRERIEIDIRRNVHYVL